MMDSIVSVMKKVAEKEAQKIYTTELGIVTAVFPHASDSDKDNYQCSVQLKNKKQPDGSDFELRKVPLLTPHIGLVNIPQVGELVALAFIGGDINAPIIMGRLYNDEDRPPQNDTGQIILTQLDSLSITLNDETKIEVDVDGNVKIEAKGDITIKADKNSEIAIKGDSVINTDGKLEITAKGDSVINADGKLEITAKGDSVINADGNIEITAKGNVKLNNGSKGAARQDDTVEVTIPAGSFITAVTGQATGTPNPAPVTVQGKITSASGTVKIGG